MGEWIAGIIIGGVLVVLFLGVPGGMVWFHFNAQRKGKEVNTGTISVILGGLLILYGLVIADGYCDFRWNNFGWVSDATPRFSFGV
ncbi:MAG TPA: hypothetical protein VFM84_02755, partial [Holophagaceae bacterium]|nr:hypothetical protein [Holophagaceae bacterium]